MNLRPRPKTVRRLLTTLVALTAITAGGATALRAVRPDDVPAAVPTAHYDIVEAAPVADTGSTTLSGDVESSGTIGVVHRLAGGATDAGNSASTAGTAPAATTAAPAGFAGQARTLGATTPPASDPTTTTTTTTMTATTTTTIPTTTMPETTTSVAAPPTTIVPATSPTTNPGTSSTTRPEGPGSAPPTAGGGAGATGGRSGDGAAPAASATAAAVGDDTGETEQVTSLPSVGDTFGVGDVLYTVDGDPVVALAGTLPAWRTLGTESDDGADIEQLERSLVTLGYGDGLTVDTSFDGATANAVEAWQHGLGLDPTGEVDLGAVVFLSDSVTVTSIEAEVGADVGEGTPIVTVTTSQQHVVVDLEGDDVMLLAPGDTVDLDVGGDATVPGTVTNAESVTAEDGTVSVEATITPSTPLGAHSGTTIEVVVTFDATEVGASGAVLVPSEAVVSRLDGTYAVRVRDDNGTESWASVELVDRIGLNAAITGDGITEGTQVLVPA